MKPPIIIKKSAENVITSLVTAVARRIRRNAGKRGIPFESLFEI